jgi:hypothetical protein
MPNSRSDKQNMERSSNVFIIIVIEGNDSFRAWAEPAYIWVYKCTPIIIEEKLYVYIIHVYLEQHLRYFELSFTTFVVMYTHYLQSGSTNASEKSSKSSVGCLEMGECVLPNLLVLISSP